MKRYGIQLDGQTFQVEILSDPLQGKVDVRIDGRTLSVKIWPLDNGGEPAESAPIAPSGERSVTYRPVERADEPTPASVSGQSPIIASMVSSPLPGTITEISVLPGQTVRTGEVLLVIEAMKMNNQIRSTRDGIIGQVMVKVGEQVSHGAQLLSWLG